MKLTLFGTWEGGHFYPLVLVGSDFVSWIFFKNFQTLLEVKIYINRVILTPCPARCPLEALKMSIFLAFQRHARQIFLLWVLGHFRYYCIQRMISLLFKKSCIICTKDNLQQNDNDIEIANSTSFGIHQLSKDKDASSPTWMSSEYML